MGVIEFMRVTMLVLVVLAGCAYAQDLTGTTRSSHFLNEFGVDIDDGVLDIALCHELQGKITGFQEYYSTNRDDMSGCDAFLAAWDTDGDWFSDEEEELAGTDPDDIQSFPVWQGAKSEGEGTFTCVDGDGICDKLYEETCYDQKRSYDSDCLDNDGDGFYNPDELQAGTDPDDAGSAPWWTDLDSDGHSNLDELQAGTSPLDPYVTIGWSDREHDIYDDELEIISDANPDDQGEFQVDSENIEPAVTEYTNNIPKMPVLESQQNDDVTSESEFDSLWIILFVSLLLVVLFIVLAVVLLKNRKGNSQEIEHLMNMIGDYRTRGYEHEQILQSLYRAGYDKGIVKNAVEQYQRKEGR